MAETHDSRGLIGWIVYSRSGIEIGTVSKLYGHSGRLTWAAVDTVRGPSHRMVPLAGASMKGASLVVAFTTETVNKSPAVKTSDARSVRKALDDLLKHYGLGARDDSALSEPLVAMADGPLAGPPAGGGDRPPPKGDTPNPSPTS